MIKLCYNEGVMPELPEVETIRRGLKDYILNKKIVQVECLTEKAFLGDITEVAGVKVTGLRRRGKALLIDLSNGKTLMVHLRMTGQLIWRNAEIMRKNLLEVEYTELMKEQFAAGHPSKNFMEALPNRQTRVIFEFLDGKLFFNDQRKFGFVKVLPTGEVEQDTFIASLGKEPWDMTGEEFFAICQRHKKALVKALLLDQKLIAGLGNIYADESLFYAGVHPERRVGSLSRAEVEKLLEGACKTMQASIDSGGSTMATYVKPDGSTGNYLEQFAQVFRREGKACPRCGEEIVKIRVAGRGTHLCLNCQPKERENSHDQAEC